jgi:hypothetical protein
VALNEAANLSRGATPVRKSQQKRTRPSASSPATDANAANAFSGFLFAAVLWAIAAWLAWYIGAPLNFNLYDPDFNPLVFLPAAFAAIGAYIAAKATRDALRAKKFGHTTLEAGPGRLGETLHGLVRTERDLAPTGDYHISLKCLRTTFVSGGRDNRGHHVDKLIWSGSRAIAADSVRSSAGIAFAFDLPADALPSRGPPVQTTSDGDVRWILEMTAPLPGLDFYAVFAVDVKPRDRRGG